MHARRPDERRDRSRLVACYLRDNGVERKSFAAQTEVPAADRRDHGDLVALFELPVALCVFLVHGVEETGGLEAEAERGPDVFDVRNVVEFALRPPGALPQPCEELDRHSHARTIA